jgi:hypothetical protein
MTMILNSKLQIVFMVSVSMVMLMVSCERKTPTEQNSEPLKYSFRAIPLSQNRLIVQTIDGGYLVDGYDTVAGYLSLFKLDSNGLMQWHSVVEKTFRGISEKLSQLHDSSFAVLYAQEGSNNLSNFTVAVFDKSGLLIKKIKLDPLYARDMIQCKDGKLAIAGSFDPFTDKTSQVRFVTIDGTISSEININRGDITSLGYIREMPDSTFLITINVYNHILSGLDVYGLIHINKRGTILNEKFIDTTVNEVASLYDLQYLSDSCLIALQLTPVSNSVIGFLLNGDTKWRTEIPQGNPISISLGSEYSSRFGILKMEGYGSVRTLFCYSNEGKNQTTFSFDPKDYDFQSGTFGITSAIFTSGQDLTAVVQIDGFYQDSIKYNGSIFVKYDRNLVKLW